MNVQPQVGVAVAIIKDDKILLGKRLKTLGYGTYSLPGGHLDAFETLEQAAIREVFEETGLIIKNAHFATHTENIWKKENKHYITFWLVAEWDSGEPINTEPDKCGGWGWYSRKELPSPMFEANSDVMKRIHFVIDLLEYDKLNAVTVEEKAV